MTLHSMESDDQPPEVQGAGAYRWQVEQEKCVTGPRTKRCFIHNERTKLPHLTTHSARQCFLCIKMKTVLSVTVLTRQKKVYITFTLKSDTVNYSHNMP